VTEPEDFIIEFSDLVPEAEPLDVLDVASGSGRHALFFARKGHSVVTMERSEESRTSLRDAARSENLSLQIIESDVENMSLLPDEFDIVVNTLFLYRPLFPQYEATLRPNGLLFFRTFTTDHLDVLGHDKPRRDFLLEPGELRNAFPGLDVVHYEESVEGRRAIATLVARAPGLL
jgi:SAM-dependent methyltransferase